MTEVAAGMRTETIEGRRTLVVPVRTGLPQSMPELLRQMETFGWRVKVDPALRGARTACTVLREHRLVAFREGRWWSARPITIQAGTEPDSRRMVKGRMETVTNRRVIPAGLLHLSMKMCEDCGAVCVRDVSPEPQIGARPINLVNSRTGGRRVQLPPPARDIVLGWYSGKRPSGREYM